MHFQERRGLIFSMIHRAYSAELQFVFVLQYAFVNAEMSFRIAYVMRIGFAAYSATKNNLFCYPRQNDIFIRDLDLDSKYQCPLYECIVESDILDKPFRNTFSDFFE